MCYRTGISKEAKELKEHFGVEFTQPETWNPRHTINGFEYPKTPIITDDKPLDIQLGRWALIPHFVKDVKAFRKKSNTLNAKIETVSELPSYRNSINRRCLVIVDRFYEYKWLDEKGKQKSLHEITVPDKSIFTLAGLHSKYTDEDTGELIESYTILTTEANTLMAQIHNSAKRMPVVLHKDEENLWLNDDALEHYYNRSEIELVAVPVESIKPTLDLFS